MKAIPRVEPASLERKDLLHKFGEDFSFCIASRRSQLQEVYALRHDVFVKELKYEMHENRIHQLEYDEHDGSAIHCFIRHNRTGAIAGCLRLIAPDPRPGSHRYRLPIEIHGKESLEHDSFHPDFLPREQICEVSRLAIAKAFREKGTAQPPGADEIFTPHEKRTFPIILIGLFLCTYTLVGLTGRRHVFAMMEPRLTRVLALSGFNFTRVSGDIFYHGKRNAFYIDHRSAEKEIHSDLLPLYAKIQDDLSPQLDATQAFMKPDSALA
jgi:N-acyl amino acid synthase of PEP-CTERM/exosortase system